MLKYNSDKKKLYEYAKENREEIRGMDEDTMSAMLVLLGEQKRLMEIFKSPGRKEEMDVCTAIDELIEDGIAEGERRGIIKGEKRGEIKGEIKGEIRGKSEGESRMAALLEDNRIDLLAAAVKDKLLRRKLFEQYKISVLGSPQGSHFY